MTITAQDSYPVLISNEMKWDGKQLKDLTDDDLLYFCLQAGGKRHSLRLNKGNNCRTIKKDRWDFMSDDMGSIDNLDTPLVSVICNTYNQEDYIGDAIESFVAQQTNFKYEILIHDDASTDGTANIVRLYEKKYPDLINPIYRTENRYSRGLPNGQIERAKGKYIAFCEGDDYWIDNQKLQKQVDIMERHPEIDICAHGAYAVKADTKELLRKIVPCTISTIFSPDEVIVGGGDFVATNTLMVRRTLYDYDYEFWKIIGFDYSLQIMGALRGGMIYVPDIMSVWRILAKGSWTERMTNNYDAHVKHMGRVIMMLNKLNDETGYKYEKSIRFAIKNVEVEKLIYCKDYKGVVRNYMDVLKKKTFKYRSKIILKAIFPFLEDIVHWYHNRKRK